MRIRNNPNANNYLAKCKIYVHDFPIILNKNTILEIGMGKGEMLCELAIKNPMKTYIGIEKFPTIAAKAAKRFCKFELKNVLVVCDDIENIFPKLKGRVNEIWLTFSDPWPKKRHYKRRLTYKKYLDIYKKLLLKNGILKIKTDNDNFFEWSKEQIINYSANIIFETNDLHNSIKNKNNIKTGYEIKWSQKGKNINYMEVTF